ncbi:Nn.00g012340.m01.CDS01 [Neocucurbitaria sp. VM-36]
MSGRLPISVLSALALGGFANALVPADPTITSPAVLPKRQNNDRFIGWVELSGSWYSETCNAGLTWYQEGKYAQCCPATLASCYAPTACVDGSLIYPYSDLSTTRTIACTENYDNTAYSVCNTAFIFENMNDSNPKTDIVCGESAVNWSYYRKVPASATEVVSSDIPTSIPQVASTADTAPDSTEAATSTNSKKSKSKAWIAGAVIGPLVGLALIGLGVFFFLRRKKNKTATAPQTGGAAMAQTDPSVPPAGVGGYTDAKPQFGGQQPQPYGQPDPYAQQGAYAAQQGYQQAPTSPAPQYAVPAQYNNAPGSPPPQQAYQSDVKYGYAGAPAGGAAELGGNSSGIAPAAPAAPTSPGAAPSQVQAAELGGGSTQHQGQYPGGAELPANTSNNKPVY